jgi:hypothetical protein
VLLCAPPALLRPRVRVTPSSPATGCKAVVSSIEAARALAAVLVSSTTLLAPRRGTTAVVRGRCVLWAVACSCWILGLSCCLAVTRDRKIARTYRAREAGTKSYFCHEAIRLLNVEVEEKEER